MDIKRKKSEVIWTTIWLSLSLIWISFLLTMLAINGITWSEETIAIIIFSNIPTFAFLSGLFTMLKSKVYIRTVEFYIHKYDRWNYNDSEYKTLYIVERVNLYSNFFYFMNVGDSTNKMSQYDLEKHCRSLPEKYDNFIGYNTQEEAMKEILGIVRDIIKEEKSEVNIKIRNVGTVETFTVEELREVVEDKKHTEK